MKKIVKIMAIVVAITLSVGILFVTNIFVGNPIAKVLATSSVKKYLSEQYVNTDFMIKGVNYSFKTNGYYAQIMSPSSEDTHFSVAMGMTGKIEHDYYEDYVLSGWNTWERIDRIYRDRVEVVFETDDFPYESNINFGEIEIKDDSNIDSEKEDFGIDVKTLKIDGVYDIYEIGEKHGSVTLYVYDEDISVKRASEILLDVKHKLDQNDVSFYAIDFVLQQPKGEGDIYYKDDSTIHLTNFLYSDIYTEGLEERIHKCQKGTIAYFEKLDKYK